MSQTAFYDRFFVMQNQASQSYDKTSLSLNLDGTGKTSVGGRKKRFLQPSPALLQSPDLKLLKLGSPELEKLIIQNNGFIPTPTVSSVGSERTDDQESFARGFIEALQKLQQEGEVPPDPTKSWDYSRVMSSQSLLSASCLPPPSYQTSHLPVITNNEPSMTSKWQVDHNLNNVPISVITSRHDIRTPSLNRRNTTPTLDHQGATVSTTGAVTTMGMTALPKSNTYLTKPHISVVNTTDMSLYPNSLASASSSILDLSAIKTEEDMPPSVGSSNSSMNMDVNPIDLDTQEHIKHQRKKLRNRLAAQRCRKRKIEREDTLKLKVKELKGKNAELTGLASSLRMQVCELKQQVMHHVNEGCQVFYKDVEEVKT